MTGPPLVTGGTGFAGSHLIEHLLTIHPAVVGWSHDGGRSVPIADRRVEWRAVDLLDAPSVTRAIREIQPSAIYHCGGFADVAASWGNRVTALRVNVLGTHHVLEAVRSAGLACPVLVTGSAMVYQPSTSPLREDDPIAPSTPYGVTKLGQELRATRERDVPVLLARPFNHAGPRQSTAYVTSSFARQIAEIEAGHAPPVISVGNLEATRDICDVRDTVRAYRLIVERGVRGRPYNVCRGRSYRIGDLLERLRAQSTSAITVEVDPARLRPSDNPVIVGDPSRLTADTGWVPEVPIERTLEDLLNYWRHQVAGSAVK